MDNKQRLVKAAEGIEGVVSTIRETIKDVMTYVDDLIAKARSPQAHEVEDLTPQFEGLDASISDLERVAGDFRAAATQAGNSQSQITGSGEPPKPASDTPTGTPETGPTGTSAPPPQATGDAPTQDDSGGEDIDSGGVTPLGQEPVTLDGPQESPGRDGVLIGDDVTPPDTGGGEV
jgi:hypothetical protein